MSVAAWMSFLTALVIALAVPGPDLVLVVQASARGLRPGLLTAIGIITGLCLHATLAVAGLAALLAALPRALVALQLLGAAVLLWMGVSMLRSRRSAPALNAGHHYRGGGFVQGFLTNATNPKALLFFAAIMPPFIGTAPDAPARTVMLCITVIVGSGLWWFGMVALTRLLGLGRSATAERLITLTGGTVLTILSLILAFTAALDAVNP